MSIFGLELHNASNRTDCRSIAAVVQLVQLFEIFLDFIDVKGNLLVTKLIRHNFPVLHVPRTRVKAAGLVERHVLCLSEVVSVDQV
jgi:hypothetical protein